MEKNEIYEIEIIDNGNNGEGIGKINNYVVFIPYAIKGELLKVKILKANKNYAYGKILEIIKASEFRQNPKCPYFYKCGGCNLQHIVYDKQLQIKTNIVKTTLAKQLSDIDVLDCVPSLEYGYRNKMQLPLQQNKIGMYRENSHDIVEIDNCLLSKNWIKNIIKAVKEYISKSNISIYDETMHNGELRHILARIVDEHISITLVINANKLKKSEIFVEILKKYFHDFSLSYCINKIKNNTILTNDIVTVYGDSTQQTSDLGINYFISPTSFLQVNRNIQNAIYQNILSSIKESDIIIDAYSGAGLLSAILSKKAKQVYGIEIVNSATANANNLMKHNNIENVKNINGDCGEELPKLINSIDKTQNIIMVLDPPRKGCDEKVLNAINQTKPTQIFYISCNPSTLARDLKSLIDNYTIEEIQPYDMFPQTKHIETLVKLKLKNM